MIYHLKAETEKRRKEMLEELGQYLQMISEEDGIPACDCIVYKDHEVVFRKMIGYRDAAKTKPVSDQDRYMLYSTTKPLTMTAVMQLIESGKLHLEDEVDLYLPEFAHMYVGKTPAKNKITIEYLMSMRGGFNYDLNGPGIRAVIEKNPDADLEEVMKGLATQPLDFEPGTRFEYSLCHDVLARVIEVVSGMSYGMYMKKHIFEPLGMQDTGYSLEEALPYLTEQYLFHPDTREMEPTGPVNAFRLTPKYESGGAGLIATVQDYGKFADAMCNDGVAKDGTRILSRESIDKMRLTKLTGVPYEDFRHKVSMRGYDYALGVRTMVNKVISGAKSPVGEFGWDGAAGAYVLMDVDNRIAIFYAQQILEKGNMSTEIHPRIRNLVYEALL